MTMKTTLIKRIALSTTLVASVFSVSAANADLPTLIVAPFTGERTHIQYWQPALGAGLADMLVTELGKINKFTVLETIDLDVLKDEIREGQDGWVDASQAVEKGGFAAADFMFTGKVTRFGHKESKVGLGGFVPGNLGNLGVKTANSDVRIDWRLVDASSRKIIKTGSATASEKGMGFNVGVNVGGSGGAIGFDNKEFMNSALGKATVTALSQITAEVSSTTIPESARSKGKIAKADQAASAASAAAEALKNTPGKVLAVVGTDGVVVTLGAKHGFKAGDKLKLYETMDTKDDQGNVVFSEEKLVGEVILQAVQEERSKAAFSGPKAAKAGWVVKAN
jgi:curli biogenesis system outer membrane secretion channel CsgG